MATQLKGAALAISHPVNVSGLDAQEFQTLYQEKVGSIYRYVFSKVGKKPGQMMLDSGGQHLPE